MAKKNTKLHDNPDTFLSFDGRTGAVMAATSQEDLKQKVQAVREIVPSRSNNDILLVLQYYDSDVDRATQAFLEDGAKEALDNWHFSGNKPIKNKKKKNKNKTKDIPSTDQPSNLSSSSQIAPTNHVAMDTFSTVSSTMGEPKLRQDSQQQNGLYTPAFAVEAQDFNTKDASAPDIKKEGSSFTGMSTTTITVPYMNGLLPSSTSGQDHSGKAYSPEVPYTDSGKFPGHTEKIPVPNSLICGLGHSLDNGLSISSTASTLSSLSTSLESSPINNHSPNLGISTSTENHMVYNHILDSGNVPTADNHIVVNNHQSSTTATIESPQNDIHKEPSKEQRKGKDRSKSREKSSEKESVKKTPPNVSSPALSRKKDIASGKKNDGAASSPGLSRKSGSHAKSPATSKKNEGNKSTNPSVSLDFGNKGHLHPKQLEVKPRERNISEASVSSTGTNSTITGDFGRGHKDHRGLEKSTKDLQRQVISLQRHRNILVEECEKAQKSISKVFSELKKNLIEREASLNFEMDQLKNQATEVLMSRQRQGADLKTRTHRAENMSDLELQELRADIKHFVSDRKIDEDIASQNKFQHDLHHVSDIIKNFGEIQTLKYNYSTRRPSVSSVSSSMTDPLSPLTPLTPMTPASSANPSQGHPSSSQNQKTMQPIFPMSSTKSSSDVVVGKKTTVTKATTFHQVTTGAKVVSQSDSVTQFETSGNFEALLQNKKDQQKTNARRSQTPSGRGRSVSRGQGRNQGQGQRLQGQKDGSNKTGNTEESQGLPVVMKQEEDPEDTDTSSTSNSEKRKSRNIRRRQKQRERQKERKQMSRSTSESSLVTGANEEKGDGDGPQKTAPVNSQSEGSKQSQSQSNPVTQEKASPGKPSQAPESRGKNQYKNRSHTPTKNTYINKPEGIRSQSSSKGRYNSGNRSQSPTKRSYYNPNNPQRSQSPMKGTAAQGGPVMNRSQSPRKAAAGHDGIKTEKSTETVTEKEVGVTGNVSNTSNKDSVKFSEDTKKMDKNSRGGSGSSPYRRNYDSPSGRGSNRGRGRGGWQRSRSKSTEQKKSLQAQDRGHSQGQERNDKVVSKSENSAGEMEGNREKLVKSRKDGVQNGLKNAEDNKNINVKDHGKPTGSVDNGNAEQETLVSSNNNNNKAGTEDQQHSFNRDDHCYEENGNNFPTEGEKKTTSVHIEEHIYEEALPQRKPRGRISRKSEATKLTTTMTTVTTTAKDLKLNGEINGISQEHRWSNEELDRIS